MSDFCPCCDDFSIDASRASRRLVKKPKPTNISVDKKAKIVINVDNSDENADWIKHVRDESGGRDKPNSLIEYLIYNDRGYLIEE